MRLSAQEEYGLRCLLQVALSGRDGPVQIAEVARAEGLSPEYTAKLLRVLRKGGLLTSVRGAGGGYVLAHPPGAITVWQATEVLDGALYDPTFCEGHSGQGAQCVHSTGCSIRALWRWIGGAMERVLREITLADLMQDEIVMGARLQEVGPRAIPDCPPAIARGGRS